MGQKYRSLIAEEPAERINALGGGGLDLNHGRGGNTCVRGNVLETAAHSNGASAQDGDGVRQVLDFAQQVACEQNGGAVFRERTDKGSYG